MGWEGPSGTQLGYLAQMGQGSSYKISGVQGSAAQLQPSQPGTWPPLISLLQKRGLPAVQDAWETLQSKRSLATLEALNRTMGTAGPPVQRSLSADGRGNTPAHAHRHARPPLPPCAVWGLATPSTLSPGPDAVCQADGGWKTLCSGLSREETSYKLPFQRPLSPLVS